MSANPFEATASALGYAYQFRYSLVSAVELYSKHGVDWSLGIEAGDDVEVIRQSIRDLTQLKQRAPGTKLTDSSSDLWKTLRIWSIGILKKTIETPSTRLLLVTTAEVPAGSAASFLLPYGDPNRNPEEAIRLLDLAAVKSKNQNQQKLYAEYLKLDRPQKLAMLGACEVLCESPNIFELRKQLENSARLAVGVARRQTPDFIRDLEGWWFEQCLSCLQTPGAMIDGVDFDAMFTSIKERFRPDQLRVDPDIESMSPPSTGFDRHIFIKQLKLIGSRQSRLNSAARDYIRASTQRSRWARNQVLLVGELDSYDNRLREEWEINFDRMLDDLADVDDPEARVKAAEILYRRVEDMTHLVIRDGCHQPFVIRGSFQHLADQKQVGWHPDYLTLLDGVTDPDGS
ncbi:ABC-three component system protein [Dactylosporangium sp. NPDC050688]|uniref:ABC-three component system protein n=1 Tax=Dactylosporangium sp. NPDC050688 TaxID=3157217 RepID=UPI0033F3B3A7